jgi:hypothetical protein
MKQNVPQIRILDIKGEPWFVFLRRRAQRIRLLAGRGNCTACPLGMSTISPRTRQPTAAADPILRWKQKPCFYLHEILF